MVVKHEVSNASIDYISVFESRHPLTLFLCFDRSTYLQCGAGHESAGEVIALGEGVTDLKVGKYLRHVIINPHR
jgi:hypothetical protein